MSPRHQRGPADMNANGFLDDVGLAPETRAQARANLAQLAPDDHHELAKVLGLDTTTESRDR